MNPKSYPNFDYDDMKTSNNDEEMSYLEKWTKCMDRIKHGIILRPLIFLAKTSATYPNLTISLTITISFFLIVLGLATNFSVETSESILWNPTGSIDQKNKEWLDEEAGFPKQPGRIRVLFHARGENVLSIDAMHRAFDVIDLVRNFEGYDEICPELLCEIQSPTGFWKNHNRTLFHQDIFDMNYDVKEALSSFLTSDGKFVIREKIYGDSIPQVTVNDMHGFVFQQLVQQGQTSETDLFAPELLSTAAQEFKLESAKSFHIGFELPEGPNSYKFEDNMVKALHQLSHQWSEIGPYEIAVNCRDCATEELVQGIVNDAPLFGASFLVMAVVCIVTLSKKDRIKSRGLLGIGAVLTIFLSILSGYGFLFSIGIPLTPLTAIFPYVMLGIGLDDTFILTDAFERVEFNQPGIEKVEHTIQTVGMSITLSTLTTVVTYFLGCMNSTAGIRWFCLYAAITISIDFLYQITFFSALMILDERRMKQRRKDFCICYIAKSEPDHLTDKNSQNITGLTSVVSDSVDRPGLIDVCIENMFRPGVKIIILIAFTILFAGSIYIASGIETALDGLAVYPQNSYVKQYFEDVLSYSTSLKTNTAGVYFRDVDVSDENIQMAMSGFVDTLVEDIPYVTSPPLFFWLRDFKMFLNNMDSLQTLPFNEQLNTFLNTEPYKSFYVNDIVRDETGTVTASRTTIIYDDLEMFDIQNEIKAYNAQQEVTKEFVLNKGLLDAHFFTYGSVYFTWELWDLLKTEIIVTSGLGLLSIFLISLIFVPHPIASMIIVPTVFFVYVETLAMFRLSGLHINGLTAVGLITCIGLVIDYSNHICMTYFEIKDAKDRNERSKKVLSTIGTSVLKGGLTTFIGVLPLAFNSTLGFQTLFITFVAITSLGLSHGFIFIPVVLSIIGPMGGKEDENISQEGENYNDLELNSTSSADSCCLE